MGFLISINGANFQKYSQAIAPPHRYSRIRDPQSAWASKAVDSRPADASSLLPQYNTKQAVLSKELKRQAQVTQRALYAKHLMTSDPICIAPEQSAHEVSELLIQKGFHHLPVVDENNLLIGILSDRDLLRSRTLTSNDSIDLKVSDIMSNKVFAATGDTLIFEIAHLMLTEKINALPIIQRQNHLIGILTTSDILKGLIRRAPIELWV